MSRLVNKLYVDQLKAEPCVDCGRTFPPAAMDFDHVRGVKVANISEMLYRSRAELDAEIAKCELVCATCHRLRENTRRVDVHLDAADAYDVDAELAACGE